MPSARSSSTPPPYESALRAALAELGRATDVRYGEVHLFDETTERLQVKDARAEVVTRGASLGASVRVLGARTWGFACTAHVTEAGLVRAAREAVAVARASSRVARSTVASPPGRPPSDLRQRIPVAFYVRNDNRAPRLVNSIATCAPLDIDDPQPAITIMSASVKIDRSKTTHAAGLAAVEPFFCRWQAALSPNPGAGLRRQPRPAPEVKTSWTPILLALALTLRALSGGRKGFQF